MVGEQDNFLLLFRVPHHDSTKTVRAFRPGRTGKLDELIGYDVSVFRNLEIPDHTIVGVLFHPRDEVDFVFGPMGK